MKRFVIMCAACFMTLNLYAQIEHRIAIMDFKASVGISQNDVDGISSIFTTYFTPQGWQLIERTQIDKIINEQGMQKSSMTESQMRRIGEILNVRKIVIGNVNIIAGSYNVDVRIVDVETGLVSPKDGATWSGTTYRSMMQTLASRLASKIAIAPKTPVTAPASSATNVITLYGYLKIQPKNLGVFSSAPTTVIAALNGNSDCGYDSWRLPTQEELELMLSNTNLVPGMSSNQPYMTTTNCNSGSQKVVRLVATDKSIKEKDNERQALGQSAIQKIKEDMVYVEGGTFAMGSDDGNSNERPVHNVTLSSYYIGKYEITQQLWTAIMGNNPSSLVEDNLPVHNVSWDDVQEFIRKLNAETGLNYRLPTEAEWEYAARGGNKSRGYKYSGSNYINEVAWYDDSRPHPVGKKSPNELGIYDMSGNVREWCSDLYGSYSSSPQTDPKGNDIGTRKVMRGGSYGSRQQCGKVSYRTNMTRDYRSDYNGFRLALSSY